LLRWKVCTSRPCGRLFFLSQHEEQVFNTTVENSVEKPERIFVSDSTSDGSAFCTGASAGTFVLQPLTRNARSPEHLTSSDA